MIYEYVYRRKVEFPDTDMAGIMHFSNYLRFMEACELEMYRELGMDLHEVGSDLAWGLPRVHAKADYIYPARFNEVVVIRLLVKRIGSKSITYQFQLTKEKDGKLLATGDIVVVAVSTLKVAGKPESINIPRLLLEKITEAPAELLKENNNE